MISADCTAWLTRRLSFELRTLLSHLAVLSVLCSLESLDFTNETYIPEWKMFRHFYLITSSKSVGCLVSKLFPLLCRVYKKKSLHLLETVRKFLRDLIRRVFPRAKHAMCGS